MNIAECIIQIKVERHINGKFSLETIEHTGSIQKEVIIYIGSTVSKSDSHHCTEVVQLFLKYCTVKRLSLWNRNA